MQVNQSRIKDKVKVSPKGRLSFGFSAMLNKPGFHSTAAISGSVNSNKPWKHKEDEKCPYLWNDMTVSISDCSRQISLEFDVDTMECLKNSRHKATVLRDAFEDVLAWIADAESRMKKYRVTFPKEEDDD